MEDQVLAEHAVLVSSGGAGRAWDGNGAGVRLFDGERSTAKGRSEGRDGVLLSAMSLPPAVAALSASWTPIGERLGGWKLSQSPLQDATADASTATLPRSTGRPVRLRSCRPSSAGTCKRQTTSLPFSRNFESYRSQTTPPRLAPPADPHRQLHLLPHPARQHLQRQAPLPPLQLHHLPPRRAPPLNQARPVPHPRNSHHLPPLLPNPSPHA